MSGLARLTSYDKHLCVFVSYTQVGNLEVSFDECCILSFQTFDIKQAFKQQTAFFSTHTAVNDLTDSAI